jgi:hypothetical protein
VHCRDFGSRAVQAEPSAGSGAFAIVRASWALTLVRALGAAQATCDEVCSALQLPELAAEAKQHFMSPLMQPGGTLDVLRAALEDLLDSDSDEAGQLPPDHLAVARDMLALTTHAALLSGTPDALFIDLPGMAEFAQSSRNAAQRVDAITVAALGFIIEPSERLQAAVWVSYLLVALL